MQQAYSKAWKLAKKNRDRSYIVVMVSEGYHDTYDAVSLEAFERDGDCGQFYTAVSQEISV